MHKLKKISVLFVFALVVLAGAQTFGQEPRDAAAAGAVVRQQQGEPSYEVLLQVLVASNAAGATQAPASLANVVKKLKATFPFSDYRVAATYMNRVENGGSIESKGIIQETTASPSAHPIFQEWSLVGLKKAVEAAGGGQNLIQAGGFRFGTRVPVQVSSVVSYENTGLNINRVNLIENAPTIIGTLNAPKSSELIVLVLTVRTAAN